VPQPERHGATARLRSRSEWARARDNHRQPGLEQLGGAGNQQWLRAAGCGGVENGLAHGEPLPASLGPTACHVTAAACTGHGDMGLGGRASQVSCDAKKRLFFLTPRSRLGMGFRRACVREILRISDPGARAGEPQRRRWIAEARRRSGRVGSAISWFKAFEKRVAKLRLFLVFFFLSQTRGGGGLRPSECPRSASGFGRHAGATPENPGMDARAPALPHGTSYRPATGVVGKDRRAGAHPQGFGQGPSWVVGRKTWEGLADFLKSPGLRLWTGQTEQGSGHGAHGQAGGARRDYSGALAGGLGGSSAEELYRMEAACFVQRSKASRMVDGV